MMPSAEFARVCKDLSSIGDTGKVLSLHPWDALLYVVHDEIVMILVCECSCDLCGKGGCSSFSQEVILELQILSSGKTPQLIRYVISANIIQFCFVCIATIP
jgi:hypothetical protein